MIRSPLLSVLALFLLLGCSGVSIVPKPVTPGALVNPTDKSIQINQSGLTVSARIQDTAVGGYDIATALASFYLTIDNRSGVPVNVSLDAFHLTDSVGKRHESVPPDEVNAILNPQFEAFLPYPFVGFYSITALEQFRSGSALASDRPYVGSGLSAVESLMPLGTGTVNNGQRVSGMLYYRIEIIDENLVTLEASLSTGNGNNLSFTFPFSIEK